MPPFSTLDLINSEEFESSRLNGDEIIEIHERGHQDGSVGEQDRAIQISDLFDKSLNSLGTRQIVKDADDLPSPNNGIRQLNNGTAYVFDGFVDVPEEIELAETSPLLSIHGGIGGIIHTGGNTAIVGNGSYLFMEDILVSAPGAIALDITGDQTKEVLVRSVTFADVGMGNFASLGTFDGMRVPSFKGVNFENFNDGLTFDGTPNKIYFTGCPFRTIDQNNVTIITLLGTLECDIVKVGAGCFF